MSPLHTADILVEQLHWPAASRGMRRCVGPRPRSLLHFSIVTREKGCYRF